MNANEILQTDLLDILFDGRNKEYGAYQLRKTYNARLAKALLGAGAILLIVLLGNMLANSNSTLYAGPIIEIPDVELDKVKQTETIVPPTPPPAVKPPTVKTVIFTKPNLVNEDVKEPMPEVDKLEDAKIGDINQDGDDYDGITSPPVDNGRGIIEAPKKQEEDYERIFMKVERESEFPGGPNAWLRYLNKNLRYNQEAIDNMIQGTIIVKFIVDKEGTVSDVEAISGPEELRAEAVRVIKKSGLWTPAIQNGRQVKTYKQQPITFRLETE